MFALMLSSFAFCIDYFGKFCEILVTKLYDCTLALQKIDLMSWYQLQFAMSSHSISGYNSVVINRYSSFLLRTTLLSPGTC